MLVKIENAKNLFYIPGGPRTGEIVLEPFVLLEARIDFNDVRTGFRERYTLNKVIAIPESRVEPVWDDHSFPRVSPEELEKDPPEMAVFKNLPEHLDASFISWIESSFIQYLLRTFSARIYRNFYLGLYSLSGESQADFVIRCIERIQEPMHCEFDAMLEIFERKLERLQEKYLRGDHAEDFDKIKTDSGYRELFNLISERIAALFLRTEFSIQRLQRPTGPLSHVHELEERLHALHFEAQEAVTKILDFYEEKVKSVDEYILHPTLKDIHLVRSFILWMPPGDAVHGR